MQCFVVYHLSSVIFKSWKGCLLLFLHRKAVHYIFGSWISGVFTDWNQKVMALSEKEHLCVWYLSQWQQGDLGHFAEEREREINMKRELLQITDLIFYLWRQIPASCAVSSYGTCQCAGVWGGPAPTRLEIDVVSLHFSFWDKTQILKYLSFTAFPVSYQFYNAFLNSPLLFGVSMLF